ncbi:MAG TPA: Hsp20/alpha crystallin family protein [Verrucomicrobiae bacterium]
MKITNIGRNDNHLIASLNAVPTCQRREADTDWFPAVDVNETEQEYVFDVDLPGLMPEEVQLEVDSAAISISGKRLPRSPSGRCLRLERPAGAFIRRFPLPSNTTGEIYGSFADGVLELRVPKARLGSNGRLTQEMAPEPAEVAA